MVIYRLKNITEFSILAIKEHGYIIFTSYSKDIEVLLSKLVNTDGKYFKK